MHTAIVEERTWRRTTGERHIRIVTVCPAQSPRRKFEQQALQGFMAIPGDNSIPVDEASHQAARDAYVLIRAARHGMGWQKEAKKFPDPVFDLIYKRVDDAWNLSRTAVDHAGSPDRAVRDASQAIRLLDQVLVMMP